MEDRGSDSTPSSLIHRLRAGEGPGWDRLIALYGPLVYRWCRLAKIQDADAADVGQEVFRAVNRKIADFESNQGTFRGWLRVITSNKIQDFFRKHQREPRTLTPGEANGLSTCEYLPNEDPSLVAEDLQLLRRNAINLVLADVDEQSRQIFWRVVAEQQMPRQVAQDLNVSVNKVYLVKSRLLRRLRDEFSELIDEALGDWPQAARSTE